MAGHDIDNSALADRRLKANTYCLLSGYTRLTTIRVALGFKPSFQVLLLCLGELTESGGDDDKDDKARQNQNGQSGKVPKKEQSSAVRVALGKQNVYAKRGRATSVSIDLSSFTEKKKQSIASSNRNPGVCGLEVGQLTEVIRKEINDILDHRIGQVRSEVANRKSSVEISTAEIGEIKRALDILTGCAQKVEHFGAWTTQQIGDIRGTLLVLTKAVNNLNRVLGQAQIRSGAPKPHSDEHSSGSLKSATGTLPDRVSHPIALPGSAETGNKR